MSAPYARTAQQRQHDFLNARDFETFVATEIEELRTIGKTAFNSTNDLDIWVPGAYIEIKEKNQNYSERFTKHLPQEEQDNIFIMDELTVRRALRHYPGVVFLVRNRPADDSLFISPIWEMVSIPRKRLNRDGKGKLLIRFSDMHPVESVQAGVLLFEQMMTQTPWLDSSCQGPQEVEEV